MATNIMAIDDHICHTRESQSRLGSMRSSVMSRTAMQSNVRNMAEETGV